MIARRGLLILGKEFAQLSEDMLARELTVRIGDEIYPVRDLKLKDSEILHKTPHLWGRVELVIEVGEPIVKYSPVKGWIRKEDSDGIPRK